MNSDASEEITDRTLDAASVALERIADAPLVMFAIADDAPDKKDEDSVCPAREALMLDNVDFISEIDKDRLYVVGTWLCWICIQGSS